MAAAASNPKFAKKAGIPQSVAKEYAAADRGNSILKQSMQAQALRQKKWKEPTATIKS